MHVFNQAGQRAGFISIRARRLWLRASVLVYMLAVGLNLTHAGEESFRVFSYHDVVLSRGELAEDSVTLDHLVNQFEWLLAHDYHPVSVTDILNARAGKSSLPSKPVLLTFDDGYVSFYDYVLPLLKAYQYPAVLALVGSWMETAPNETVAYGREGMPRSSLLSWEQVREIESDGLVEIASHSFDLHREVIATPQGNGLAAATSLKYNKKTKQYETQEAYRRRIQLDMEKAQANFEERLGHPVRVIVWPYGRYTDIAVEAAVEEGFGMALTLNREPGRLDDLLHTGRYYVWRNPIPQDFRGLLENPLEKIVGRFPLLESGSLSEDELGEEKKLSAWLERCSKMHPDGVCIRPYEFRNGKVAAFFPSRYLPIAQDRLLRLVWQTRTRGRSRSILWLVNDDEQGWKDVEMIQTWPELGPLAPVAGIVIGGPELTPAILDLPWGRYNTEADKIAEQSPSMRRQRRQLCLKENQATSGLPIQILKKLEGFQKWQPYSRVSLTLPWERARAMKDSELRNLLMVFDRLVLDARGISLRDLEKGLRQHPLQSLLATHGQLLVDFNYDGKGSAEGASRRLAKKLKGIENLGILSWIYDHDWPVVGQPSGEKLRLLMSSEEFPWNDPEFRLWSEVEEKSKQKGEER
jgi:peptidoglycan/xylan/chitin deacetylase (PgdA/CDA1 family)